MQRKLQHQRIVSFDYRALALAVYLAARISRARSCTAKLCAAASFKNRLFMSEFSMSGELE